ncbi:MAG TPA: DUF4255 domain-containing protein [Flavobacteriaceae bacterium]|nr:DUF4255 domain-containing protein [Flavobacteriaceae bacterium]MCB9213511.1 DUF4255 domain-containing protein [Alteromonas sp.]HPF10737.1 DUF4255 domain-containing protein [Flavobacteriaceae bacterium]HQU21555.1 DUF4255 domain-containing protein [Flavobacteriaceae bacterium]HQU65524.1 DUF4255 domain-containing protein [Flavobacteriaceae bacterium]
MIYETLEIIKDQVSQFLDSKLAEADLLVLENIAKVDDPDTTTMNDKVVLSLINLEEETALKNHPNVHFKNGNYETKNKPVNLNMYVLFSCNRSVYTKSMAALSAIIEFFQGKKVFNQQNTVLNPTIPALDAVKEFRFVVDLYTPTFEQLNYVWGTLGGKSVPNVMYKVSIVSVEGSTVAKKGTPILEIESIEKRTS